MRGLYTAAWLEQYSQHIARRQKIDGELDVGKGFDLIAGTSTGGIIATALSFGLTPKQITKFYNKYGPKIFRNPYPIHWPFVPFWLLFRLFGPANNNKALKKALGEEFGAESLQQLFDRRGIMLCIPTINVGTNRLSVIKTPHGNHNRDNNLSLVNACLATSAAPIVLPLAAIDDPDSGECHTTYVDGGLCANNPILISLIEAQNMLGEQDRDIEILSLGTCPHPTGLNLSKGQTKRGLWGWKGGISALEVSTDAQSRALHDAALFLSKHLKYTANGQIRERKVTIIRPPQTEFSASDSKHIQLDRATRKARNALECRGKLDADNAAGAIASYSLDQLKILEKIFKDMKPMEVE